VETKSKVNTLTALARIGQSPWYDNIDRRFVKNGKLKELFDSGILGVTSNPTIFEKAVSASDIYDPQIKELSLEGKKPLEIYDILTTEDVAAAADLLIGTYEKTNHVDGYVSIEVWPEFAHDAKKTVEYARRIFKTLNRPNIMIKVPGTTEGREAIRVLIKEGINVNATLLFSVGHYEKIANAYTGGIKDRLKEKKDVKNIISVASVFVSRIDSRIDKILDEKENLELKGKIAVSYMKMIYQKFKEIFESSDFKGLKSKGANAQRVLWASTSTKNPSYRDVMYVEDLIGPNTINTMPPKTVDAFLRHGKVELTIEKDMDKARSNLAKIKSLGINIDSLCQEIQDAGVGSFQTSFDKLICAIAKKQK